MDKASKTMKTSYNARVLAILTAVVLSTASVFAAEFEVRGIKYFTSSDTEVYVAGSIINGNIVIPETVSYDGKTYSVVGVGENAFSDRRDIYSVSFPKSVKQFSYRAFYSNQALCELRFSEGLEVIGNDAFGQLGRYDNYYGGFALPNSVTTIGVDAFRSAIIHTSTLDLPESLTSIQEGAFREIGGGVQTIILHKNLTSMGNGVFYGVTSINEVYCLAATPPTIDDGAFQYVAENATLYVTSSALSAYQGADGWKGFKEIKAIEGNVPCSKPDIHFFEDNWLLNITCATPHATIYYTTDGSNPTTSSTKYTTPIFYTGNKVVKAMAVCDGYGNSEVSSFEKNDLTTQCPLPVVSISEDFVVKMQSAVPGAKIYYTFNEQGGYGWGTNYNLSISKLYDGEFTLTQATHIFALVLCDGWEASNVIDVNYYNNYFVNAPSIYVDVPSDNSTRTITIPSNHEGATVYYTIDGSDPNTSATRQLYTEPFTIDHDLTIKAISTKEGRINSPVTENFVSGIDSRFKQNGIYYRRIDNNVNDEVEVTYGDTGYSGEITIPSSVSVPGKTYTVTRIGYRAFRDQHDITSISMPNTIVSIGEEAFYSYNGSIREIKIPSSVRSIEANAFANCNGMESIILNEGLESIGNYAFTNNYALTQMTVPSTVKEIGHEAFRYCSKMTRCTLGDALLTMGDYVFANCTELRTVNLPANLKSFGIYCFGNCNNLQSIKIPKTVTVIPRNAFEYCYALSSVEIPATVKEIQDNAFWHCEKLASAVVPEGVTSINYGIFSECYSLSSVSLPSTVTTIGEYGFYNCRSLTSITLPASLTQIDRYAFNGCTGLTAVYLLATTPPLFSTDNTLLGAAQQGATLYVPADAVDTYKFTRMWQEFDPNIAAIGNLPAAQPTFFLDNYTLTISTQTSDAAIYYTSDGSDPTTSSTRYTGPFDFLRNDTIRAIAVKDGMDNSPVGEFIKNDYRASAPEITVEEVGEGTFEVAIKADTPDARLEEPRIYYTTNLRWGWASWPSDASDEMLTTEGTKLYNGKFTLRQATHVAAVATRTGWLSSPLADLNLWDGFQLNQPALYWDRDAQMVTIDPNNADVTVYYTIDSSDPNDSQTRQKYTGPFALTRNLTVRAIAVQKGHFNSPVSALAVTDFDSRFFVGDIRYRLVDNTVENEVEVTGRDDGYSGKISIPESITYEGTTYRVTRVGANAFYNCDGLTSISLPETITSIGSYAFHECDGLATIVLPSSVRTVENNAFFYCRKLTNITLPEGLTSLGYQVFGYCSSLNTIMLPSTLEAIPEYAFCYCSNLLSVKIPEGITTIGGNAFYYCSKLASAVIPEGVTEIPYSCFEDCHELASVTLPSTLTTINTRAFISCQSLSSIVLPASVKDIYMYAFNQCDAMNALYVNAATPPALHDSSSFAEFFTSTDIRLFVPEGAVATYKDTDIWKEFTSIAPIGNLPVGQPTFFLENFTLTISSPTAGAVIYYTNDNTDPTTSSRRYTAPIDLVRNDTIRAIAVKDGMDASEIGEFRMNNYKVATPDIEFSFAERRLNATSASPDSRVSEAKLYYTMTTDGYWGPSTYTTEEEILKNATPFTEPLTVNRPGQIQVVALRDGWLMSDWRYFDFYSDYRQDQPSISWDYDSKTVTISHNDTEVTIYYTLDGSDPNSSDTRKRYTAPFTVLRNHVVRAIVEKPDHFSSLISEYSITGIDSRFQKGGLYYRMVDNTEENIVEVTSPAEGIYEGDIVIPESITNGGVTYRVTRIGNGAFAGQSGVTSVQIPTTVTAIGSEAFRQCDGLTAIDIPASVTSIENYAFSECRSLAELTLHNGLESIGDHAFYYATSLTKLVLPSTLTTIDSYGFAYCNSVTEVTFPQNLTTIGAYTFNACRSLTELNLPNSVTTIGEYAFSHNEALTSIHIPEKLTKLPQDMLSYCYQLENVTIPASVQELSQGVFYQDSKLTSLTLPEGITRVPLYLCSDCSALVNVSLPSTITTIETEAFRNCTSLQSVILPAAMESLDNSAFTGCTAMTSVYSMNATPPSIQSSTWSGVTGNATLYVPTADAVAAYESASYWSNFKAIEVMGEGLPCAQPSFSFADYVLTMATQTAGATIYYTDDDSDPATSATRKTYSKPIDFWKNDTIQAVAVKAGMTPSPIGTFIRNDFKVATPAVAISDDLVITVTTDEPVPVKTEFYYRYVDGNNTPSHSGISTPADVRANCTLYDTDYRPTKPGRMLVIALRDGWIMSDWAEFDYYTNFYLDKPGISYNQSKRAVILSHTAEGVIPRTSNAAETHRYAIRNAAHTDYYVVASSAPTAGNPVQLGSSKTDTPAQFVLKDIAGNRKAIYVVIAGNEYPVAATANTPSANSVKAYYSVSEVPTDWLAEWYVEDQGNENYVIQTPENTVSWNENGGAGENIGLYYSYYKESTWSFISADSQNEPTGLKMYYTLDGSEPTEETGTLYTDTIFLTENTTVKAFATKFRHFNSEPSEQTFTWFRVAKPVITFNAITATITCDEPCDTLFYTLDNTNPTRQSTVYTGPFTLNKDCVVRAMGVHKNWTDSEIAVATYSASEHTCATPTFNTETAQMRDSLLIISTATDNARIYYTTDGTNPTDQSTLYTAPVKIECNMTVRAVAMRDDMIPSPVAQHVISWVQLHEPMIEFTGIYCSITQDKPGSTIYFTTDETDPTKSSTRKVFTEPFVLTERTVIKAYAVKERYNDSEVASRTFDPTGKSCAKPSISADKTSNIVTMNTTTEGATIYYTTNGLTPTRNDKVYTEPFEVTQNQTIKAVAMMDTYYDSDVTTFDVDWFTVARPVITVDGIFVTMSCPTPDARIYYTTNGNLPTTEDNLYTDVLTMTADCTIKAFAVKDNFNESQVVTEVYVQADHTCGTPTFNRVPNTNYVSISSSPSDGTTIYYTLDGTAPTRDSQVFDKERIYIEVTENGTLRALAVNPKLFDSAVGEYAIDWFKVDKPQFAYDDEGRLVITCDTAGVTIYYAFDSEATTSSAVYREPIVLTDNRTVYAFGTRPHFHDSDMATHKPGAFVCDDVTYDYNGRYLTMTSTDGATIHYTLDGTAPTASSPAYTEPVEITALCTVKAVAMKQDYTDSNVTSFAVTYLFNGEDVDMSEAGHLEEAFKWLGGTEGLTSLPVSGQVDDDDIRFIKGITTLEHLDLSNATVAGKRLPGAAFAGMNIVSFQSPKEVGEIGEHLFQGCKRLAAIVWNASSAIPQSVLDDVVNPNLLLYVNSSNLAPSTYTGNLVIGGVATTIALSDAETGGAFYCPQRFYAQDIRYTHDYRQPTPDPALHAAQGWETLALPFDVQTVTHETRGELAPFAKGADRAKYKPFWLYTLTETGFVRTSQINAYTPYVISMPNHSSYADDYILAGKVTFSATDVYVEADQARQGTWGSYDFIPSLQRMPLAPHIMNLNLNDYSGQDGTTYVNGSAFIPGLRDVKPFEAYIVNHSLQATPLRIGDLFEGGTTDIMAAEMDELGRIGQHEGVFDLTGRQISVSEADLRGRHLLERGLYIINGQKVMVK